MKNNLIAALVWLLVVMMIVALVAIETALAIAGVIGRRWLTLIGVSVVALVLLLSLHFAHAHDHSRPELDGWFLGLQSKGKVPCCDGAEAMRIDDVDWESKDGHYRVRLQGEWVDVPESAVVDGPNRAGPTMVWPYYLDGEMRGVRCFLPGSMT